MTAAFKESEHKAKIVEVAQAILDGKVELLKGCRVLVGHIHGAGIDISKDQDALKLIGIESETDAHPVGETRSLWNRDALAESDREMDAYWSRKRSVLMSACAGLVRRYSR